MKVITDSPVALSGWNIFPQEAEPHHFTNKALAGIWSEFAGDTAPWWFELAGDGIPKILVIVVEKARRSQFDRVVELTRQGCVLPDGLTCVALEGENFHGQSKRPWKAVRGNLHLTAYFKAGVDASETQETISILPTLALTDAFNIIPNPKEHTGIRWLNDLFVEGQKIAGTITVSEIDRTVVDSVVYGIGVNVETAPNIVPDPFVPMAGSIQSTMLGSEWSIGRAFLELIKALNRRVEELKNGLGDQLNRLYIKNSACIGEKVRVWPRKVRNVALEPPIGRGTLLEILPDLSVVIEDHPGSIPEGRLAFESDCRAVGL